MDYSDRVNSKKGAGGIADAQEANVQTRRRIKELLTTQVLDIENDPYVFRNHLGVLECRLCLTTHISESSYISHLGGKKHQLNLEKRRRLDAKYNKNQPGDDVGDGAVSINQVEKRSWIKIGKPAFKVTKIRDPETNKLGLLVQVTVPKIKVEEPQFRIMSYYELSGTNRNRVVGYLNGKDGKKNEDPSLYQYLVISAEPYENVCIAIPNNEINKSEEVSDTFWWYFDVDTKEYFIQLLFQ